MSKIIASHKVINKSSQLQSLLDDSNRLAPFILALLDDLNSRQNTSFYLRHLVKSYTEVKYPKHLTVFCLENVNKEQFVVRNRILMNHNVTLVNEDDLFESQQTEFDLRNDEFTTKLASFNKPSMDNVLLLDSLVPLFMCQSDVSVETATKNICAWFSRLQTSFSHIIFVLHTDFTLDRYLELALSHISSAIVDFRLNSGLSVPACPATKLTQNSIHCHVIAKKKHPRTHLKVARKHEHFQVDQSTGNIIKHISSDELEKIIANNAKIAFEESKKPSEPLPESTFNLTLKKEEQEAKDSLILPYMRKNITNSNSINTNVPVAGGLAANTTISSVTTTAASQITYHYDQFDDFDEDDPDDDLDF